MVAAGELPAVEDRLPDEVVVVDPLNEMGVYGGEYRAATISPGCCGDFEVMFTRFQNLLTVSPEIDATIPNVALDWDLTAGLPDAHPDTAQQHEVERRRAVHGR